MPGMYAKALKRVGRRRGKMISAKLSEEQKDLIYRHNAARILAAQGKPPLNAEAGRRQGEAGEVA